jgi:hypothetical protein
MRREQYNITGSLPLETKAEKIKSRGRVYRRKRLQSDLAVDVSSRLMRKEFKDYIRPRRDDPLAMRNYSKIITFVTEMASEAVLCANAQLIISRRKWVQMCRPTIDPLLSTGWHKSITENLFAYQNGTLTARQTFLCMIVNWQIIDREYVWARKPMSGY